MCHGSWFPIPIGGEEFKQDGNGNDNTEGEQYTFTDTDACKTLDDYLNFITNKLPEFDHLNALVSAKLLGEVDKIEDSHENNQAYHHLRVALNKAIPLLNASKTSLENEISQLKITISSQKDAMDIHKSKVKKQGKLLNEASHSEDADLTTQVDNLKVEFTKLQEERHSGPRLSNRGSEVGGTYNPIFRPDQWNLPLGGYTETG